jgi:GH25 family lysozyme M1 (1,4-beta-N-acetylmuramidase)
MAPAAAAMSARKSMTMAPAAAKAVTPMPGSARGIDISSNNAEPAWATLKSSGASFTAIKATEGDYYANAATTTPVQQPGYAAEVADAAAAGLYVMPYAFGNPHDGNGDGTCQADFAWQEISSVANPSYSGSSLMLPVVLDIEQDPYANSDPAKGAIVNSCYNQTAPGMVTWIGQFLTEISAKSGRTPIIYTNPSFWSICTGNSAAFSSYPLWVADYGVASPTIPPAWGNPALWQYTSSGTASGVTGNVDLDYLAPVLQTGTVGAAVQPVQLRTLTSLNAPQAVTYSATAGGLPPGLSVSGSGLITGTPTQAGSYTVTVNATGVPSTISFTWNVAGTITLTPQPSRSTPDGYPTTAQVSATDTNAGASGYSPPEFTATGLPPGLSISPAGAISGWTAAAGAYSVKVTATDGLGATASASFKWTITAAANSGPAGTIRQHGGSNLCLDDPSSKTANGTAIDLATCNGKTNQSWTAAQDGTLRVLGHCLEASGTSLILMTCNTSPAEQWRAGTFGALVSVRYGTCLNGPSAAAASGTRPTLATCQNVATKVNQHWTRPAGPATSGAGARCLGLSGAIAALVTCATSTAQNWTPEPSGTFALQANGRCLAEHTTAGSTMSIVACSNTTPTQQWQLVAAGNIAVELKNPATGLCITVPAGGTTGTKLVLGTCSTGLNSTWRVA